jgi:polyribonucleotide nucleotidyltransferase
MSTVMELDVAGRKLTIETGRMARQAHGSVLVRYGDSAVLVAAVSDKTGSSVPSFLPLTIEYRERSYAAGKIPGGFFKREGRPSEVEILAARLIDRPLRPLFPKGYSSEIQVHCMVVSSDSENNPDLLGLIGASASLMISDIPWAGPVSAVRIGHVDGALVINPTFEQLEKSLLDLIVAVRGNDVVMLEGGCREVPESVIAEAVELARVEAGRINDLQMELVRQAGKPKRSFTPAVLPEGLSPAVAKVAEPFFAEAYGRSSKEMWHDAVDRARERATADLAEAYGFKPEEDKWKLLVIIATDEVEKAFVRGKLAHKHMRCDGRAVDQIRPIWCEVGVLPRAHGSALFTRGETQALVAATLGGDSDEQRIDALTGEYMKSFMLHYNFPSFSVGEVKPIRGPGRREIGHGHLAEMAIQAVIPGEEFPYTIRIVSDILESNGSSSMASVCGSSLCLMDAGVPIKAPVAGVALGLVKDGDDYVILTDIAGVEDHLGDMDLKIAGTAAGVTAVQMDLKVEGISTKILAEAFERSRQGRLHVLSAMAGTMSKHREELSMYAPRVITTRINTDKIGKLIGPGGKMIRSITEETGVKIDIADDGTVSILSTDAGAAEKALRIIEGIVGTAKVGKIYEGTVTTVAKFGAFVEILPGTDGLVHISEISKERIREVSDVMKKGDRVRVKVIEVREDGKINLTMKDLDEPSKDDREE